MMHELSFDEVKNRLKIAIELLFQKDNYLFKISANERSITHKLGCYLQIVFSDWDVDCEFNKNIISSKKLKSLVKTVGSDNIDGVSVYPDIIIHKRNSVKHNLLAIEVKKSNNKTPEEEDINKLLAFEQDLLYKYTCFIKFSVGSDQPSVLKMCWPFLEGKFK